MNERVVSIFRRVWPTSRLCIIKKLRNGRLERMTSRDERIIEIEVMLIIDIINKIGIIPILTTYEYNGHSTQVFCDRNPVRRRITYPGEKKTRTNPISNETMLSISMRFKRKRMIEDTSRRTSSMR
jgi:hypothetical protein